MSIAAPGEHRGATEANNSISDSLSPLPPQSPEDEMKGRGIQDPVGTSTSAQVGVQGWAAGVVPAWGKQHSP